MSSNPWDNLRRDPELWHRDGNCYVHLYGQGRSRRGPSFKVRFSMLLETACHPLADQFMAREVAKPVNYGRDDGGELARRSLIELFIPAPPQLDERQAFEYHLSIRNLFAFVFRRSMVGENLGTTLIALMRSMREFRNDSVDNIRDMMDYLDEEGYLNLERSPTHALAILHFAEAFQLTDLYITAFAHCCGMSDQLFTIPEYKHVSPTTRKLIRRAQVEMNLKLGRISSMIASFLRDELSEAHLGLYSGAQMHLQQFRSLLQDYYAAKFGSYPPPSIDPRTTIFEAEVFRIMSDDFKALMEYLVDETLGTTHSDPFLAQGGIWTRQIIRSFDTRHGFTTLIHTLPRLPKVSQESSPKRIAWLGRQTKLKPRQREITLDALLTAANHKDELLKNGLVRAYRRFEEDSIDPPAKGDRIENLGPIDGRKVRWVLIYAMYQALRQASEIPPGVKDASRAPYHLCISTTDIPPWSKEPSLYSLTLRRPDRLNLGVSALTTTDVSSSERSNSPQRSFEIKPDIDYFSAARREDAAGETRGGNTRLRKTKSWTESLTKSLPFNLPRRRSSSRLAKQFDRETRPGAASKVQHVEIIVQDYGNGMQDSTAEPAELPPPPRSATSMGFCTAITEEDLASASPSRYSSNGDLRSSAAGGTETLCTFISGIPSETTLCLPQSRTSWSDEAHESVQLCYTNISATATTTTQQSPSPEGDRDLPHDEAARPTTTTTTMTTTIEQPIPPKEKPVKPADVALPIVMPSPRSPTAWDQVQATMEVEAQSWRTTSAVYDVMPEWEQYSDLGGLTELVPSRTTKPSSSPAASSYSPSLILPLAWRNSGGGGAGAT
ncbi:hypothetical protein GGS23DRAFT_599942 [Durotheca rogersii]|uniref:uncharacterized protein n=1 Tax=Durotheca rogersii TaxID=419775 RepID=UPI00221EAC34|nr:uncharacterized protein GGS23DRAFT_599942 [Durotheca rogersii]KAI5860014.1 hypothetical protein GGS23DRAFT_599942 [Durotheca rogersii]